MLPENEPTINLYYRVKTQWVYTSGMSNQKIGLNYQGVESVARLAKIEITDDMFAGLQIIESEFLNVDAEKIAKRIDQTGDQWQD